MSHPGQRDPDQRDPHRRDTHQLDIEAYLALLEAPEPWPGLSDEAQEELGAELLDAGFDLADWRRPEGAR